jgi:PAS domain S-box-containing protein
VGLSDRFQPIIRLWNRWIEPVDSVQDAERRQESRTLAGLLLVVAILIFFVLPVRYLVNPDPQTPRRIVSGMIGVMAILIAYWFARRGRNQAAVLLAIGLATVLIFVTTTVLDPSLGTGSLYYLTVISVFASLFLPIPKAFFIALTHVIGMILLPVLNPSYSIKRITDGPLSFTLILTLTVLVFAWYRTQLEQKRQMRLTDSETRYRIISDMISDYAYSYTIDADGTLHEDWITGSFTRVTGYTWEELGQYVLFHPDDNAKASEDVKRVIRGESVTNDYRIITKSGQERWMRITRQPLWDTQQKRVTRFIAVAQDVTQGHEADAQKLRMAVQQGRLGVIGAFVQAVSHDFRTSLATIETSRYLIEKTFNSINPMKTLARLTTIQQSVGHLTQQLENLQTLSALIAPKTEMSGMNKLVNDLILAQVPAAQRKNIALIFAPELYLSPVVADIGEVRRAINHLLLNALNYTPEGGKVNVRTYQANKMVSVEIRDSGIGIEADALEQIFDFFYRADPSRSLESGGVGLGLSIVRMIAEAHNGTVTVTSTPGQGSIFTFSLPALPAESSRAAS